MPEGNEITTRNLELARESEELPLPSLITMLFDMELPIPVFDHQNRDNKIGDVVYAELSENTEGVHVITGGVINV